jgi:N-acetyl sugar amidotransferase
MDTSDPDITFDENGYCNHCTYAFEQMKLNYSDKEENKKKLNQIIETVKKAGEGKNYDCIIGLSGGVDSSYLAYVLVKEFNLRPLAIHLDNGWNSEQAVSNIHNLVTKLKIDLITHVIDWEEFKDLQKAFLRASVIDLEMLSDHAIVVVINKIAKKLKLKYFLIGGNFQTESIIPRKWFYSHKRDSGNIRDIHRKFGNGKRLKTFPYLTFYNFLTFGKKYGQYLMPLSYLEYDKVKAKKILIEEIGWQDYGAKHHESFITKFYQIYILPKKFNVDKRRAHLSSLISCGQVTRDLAIEELNKPQFKSKIEEVEAIEYFCKKMGITSNEFNEIMNQPRKEHQDFESFISKREKIFKIAKSLIGK